MQSAVTKKVEPAALPVPEMSAELKAFSAQLAQRYPDRWIQRFVMPANVRECREVFLMEITSRDEIRAAAMADATMSPQERTSNKLATDAERRECIRLSIVGLGERRGAVIAYRNVNGDDDLPFVEMNDWSSKAMAALNVYFGELNGVPMDEIRSGIEGAQTVGAFALPQKIKETQGSAA